MLPTVNTAQKLHRQVDFVTAHWQVLANPFAWPVLLGGVKAVPPIFDEVSPVTAPVPVAPPPLQKALQATDAGHDHGILYETAWQAVDRLKPHMSGSAWRRCCCAAGRPSSRPTAR
jgi:predicted  nucleic acid-binding Zn ribbon protein